jgi:hypothetical protein
MEKESIKLKRAYLAGCQMITQPGKYSLTVSSAPNLFTDDKGSRYIVGTKAIAEHKLAQARELFKESEEVDIEQTQGLFLTGNIWVREGYRVNLPAKGENVDCNVDYVPSREGDMILAITSLSVKEAVKGEKINLDTFFAATEVPAEGNGTTLQHS